MYSQHVKRRLRRDAHPQYPLPRACFCTTGPPVGGRCAQCTCTAERNAKSGLRGRRPRMLRRASSAQISMGTRRTLAVTLGLSGQLGFASTDQQLLSAPACRASIFLLPLAAEIASQCAGWLLAHVKVAAPTRNAPYVRLDVGWQHSKHAAAQLYAARQCF